MLHWWCWSGLVVLGGYKDFHRVVWTVIMISRKLDLTCYLRHMVQVRSVIRGLDKSEWLIDRYSV